MCSVMMRVTVLRFCSLAAPICSFGLKWLATLLALVAYSPPQPSCIAAPSLAKAGGKPNGGPGEGGLGGES